MEKKVSIGIIIFSLYLFFIGVWRLMGTIDLKSLMIGIYYPDYYAFKMMSPYIVVVRVIAHIVLFSSGLFMLLKRDLARRTGLLVCVLLIFINSYYVIKFQGYYSAISGQPVLVILIIQWLWYLVPIYFFTRPKVKEQFK